MDAELQKIKLEAQMQLDKLNAASPAKEVAGKAIGTYGLPAIVVIVIIGVLASLQLDEGKMAAVMGLLGASLTALISMLNSIAGSNTKEEKPEFEVMKQLIERLDKWLIAILCLSKLMATKLRFVKAKNTSHQGNNYATTTSPHFDPARRSWYAESR